MRKKLPANLFKRGVWLAPIAGYSDVGFRKLCYQYGAQYTFCEMVSAYQLASKNSAKFTALDISDIKTPTGIQIITPNATILISSLLVLNKLIKQKPYCHISSICLNLGCPVQKKSGAYLLNNLELIEQLFSALKQHATLPIGAKIRLAINETDKKKKIYLKITKLANKYLDFLIVHGRTLTQLYRGSVDLEAIKQIKQIATIPVVGNGDIKSPQDAELMFKLTKCDAVMIAREAMKRPWIFKRIKDYFVTSKQQLLDEAKERMYCLKKYLDYQQKYNIDFLHTRMHVQLFFKNKYPQLNLKINSASSVAEIRRIVEDIK